VIGAGAFASRRHLPDVVKDERAALTAACRRDAAALATVADHFQIPARYNDWQKMLAEEPLDAVIIATPHDQHAEQAIAALDRGIHVLLEKPMAISVADAERVAEAAEASGCILAPYWRHTTAMREGLREGKIGKLESVTIRWSGSAAAVFGRVPLPDTMPGVVKPTLFRADAEANGGGYLFDGGGHLFSELLWVTRQKPVEVTCMMDRVPDDMRASVMVRLENGVIAQIIAIGDSEYQERRIRSSYAGSSGGVVANGIPFSVSWSEPGRTETEKEEGLPGVPSPVVNWLDCIADGREPLGSIGHALMITRLLAASYESAASGKSVKI
jgi:predicted dehydrogenase